MQLLTKKTPAEILDAQNFLDIFHDVIDFRTMAGDKMTITRLSDMRLVYSIYPDREQQCVFIVDGRGIDLKDYVYPVLCLNGNVTQVTIESYLPIHTDYNPGPSDLEQVFLVDPMRIFTRRPLINFMPIGDPVSFVLPACITDTGLELVQNNFAVKRIRRPFDSYNNAIFLNVDFPRGSKLVVRIESISLLDYDRSIAFGFEASTQPPALIESMEKIGFLHNLSFNMFSLDLKNTRTVEDITIEREADGSVVVMLGNDDWQDLPLWKLIERNDIYPYINLIGCVDRISLIEYRHGDGRNVQELGLDLVPAI